MTLETSGSTGFRVVQRTIVDPEQELDVRSLYMGGVVGVVAGRDETGSGAFGEAGFKPRAADDGARQSEMATGMTGWRYSDEGRVTVDSDERVTFGTYFNAFPASYWRRWTDVQSVTLQVTVRGTGSVIVYRSTSKGHVLRADSASVEDDGAEVRLTFDLSLAPFIDGGWYWFDLEAGHGELELVDAHWGVETDRLRHGTVSLGITTFNRAEFCVDQLVNLATRADLLEVIDAIYVVDQGTELVRDEPRFAAAAESLGDKLVLLEQGNLGGSGGFARAMSEASSRGDSDYVLLLDDDVVCELEGIFRAIAFADLASKPTIVGGHMFSLYVRSVLHAFGETIAKYRWFWGPAPDTVRGHDFAHKSLRGTPWLHRRIDVDYNGWWMCLIPTQVIREIGLSMPMFIKWDDAEFGLRAGKAGFPTVSLPGVAVWHVPWTEKDDTVDWQAYFHERNRLTSALLHSPYEHGGKLIRESFETLAKHAVSMQYSPAEMILMAIEDVLAGPSTMHHHMATRLGELREMRKQYSDAVSQKQLDAFPEPRLAKPPKRGKLVVTPQGPVGKLQTLASGAVRQLRPVKPLAEEHPQAVIPHVDQRWWRFMQLDSALVSSADGTSASWYKRNPALLRDQLRRSAQLHARLYAEWPDLARRYRDALGELTSPETWKATFEGSVSDDA